MTDIKENTSWQCESINRKWKVNKIYQIWDIYNDDYIVYCVVATNIREARKFVTFNNQYETVWSDYQYMDYLKCIKIKRRKELDWSKYPVWELDWKIWVEIWAYTWY